MIERKNVCFISSCYIEEKGLHRLEHLLNKINNTALIKKLEKLFIVNIGKSIEKNVINNIFQEKDTTKIEIINYSPNTKLYELPALELIRVYSKFNPDKNILYLQTKGISYDRNLQTVNDWIDLMLYWIMEKHEICLELLNSTNIDTIGCNKSSSPHPHYSGNFWWAKTNWLQQLAKIEQTEKAYAEWWLLSNNDGIHKCLYNSNINHYEETYPRSKYVK